jgi:Family of unknown function (DUF6011)
VYSVFITTNQEEIMRAVRRALPASQKQIDFARTLINELEGDNAEEFFQAHIEAGTFDSMPVTSGLIDALLERKRAQPRGAAEFGVMPKPGYYCANYQGVLRFYRVVAGKGKWEGRTFINRYKSDELGRVFRAEQSEVVPLILADPEAAAKLFAEATEHCYVCGRRLTDALSRELGIGPDCRGRR